MNWGEFKSEAPELAALGGERFDRTGVAMVGTLRKNGWPRISPVEPLIVDGNLYLGMMWQSRKALDLLRDPRCTVHTTVSNRNGSEGEFKLYGRAIDVQDAAMRRRYCQALYETFDWGPGEEEVFHLFSVDIESAAFGIIEDGERWVRRIWRRPSH
jgi:hypothetical protein